MYKYIMSFWHDASHNLAQYLDTQHQSFKLSLSLRTTDTIVKFRYTYFLISVNGREFSILRKIWFLIKKSIEFQGKY